MTYAEHFCENGHFVIWRRHFVIVAECDSLATLAQSDEQGAVRETSLRPPFMYRKVQRDREKCPF